MSIARIRPKTVYHYCSLETFFAIFSNSTIRLSNISKSNDSEEITYLLPKMKKFCTGLFNYYIKEIIIGSKANINDLDLELFLLSNGYNPMNIYIHKSDIPYR